ncbi:FAD-dependent oxidoreductase [Sulfurimonas sp.]|uniref:phytoene desaturase family protein n=1 Tax=Sulfurimonas sp. TaxID=2022749 RepID=UPI0025ED3F9F|nr:FAD-dependent oxidoreductase [Sulfurimonas sp.]
MNIAIVGGGLSGLLCAFLLEKKGYSPTIYEKLPKTGGVIDSFRRKKIMFDVGFHYSGSLAPKQFLYEEFKKYGLLDKLELYSYEGDFDTLYFDEEKFSIPNSSVEFKQKLQTYFESEKDALDIFFDKCYEASKITLKVKDDYTNIDSRSLGSVMSDIKDTKLRKILLHFTIFYAEVQYEDASFEIYAKIMINMLDGTRKIKGNGRAIVDALKSGLKNTTIKTRDEISQIIHDENGIQALKCKDGIIKYDAVISTLHPRTTTSLLNLENKKLKRYAKHVSELKESPTFFSIFCLVDADIASNLYFYGDDCISVLPSTKINDKRAITVIARSNYTDYTNLEKEEYKRRKQEECKYHISTLKKLYDFGEIEVIDCSTPLTKQHYSNGHEGSAYGILCSAKQKSLSMVMPKTRVENLYLAGESALAPGLLGCYLGAQKVMNYFE